MPQMSPMSWVTLMIMFIMLVMIINNVNYFNMSPQMKHSPKNKSFKSQYWKW